MIDKRIVEIEGLSLPLYSLNTVIVGSGAAGLGCAARLFREMAETGVADPRDEIAVVTRGVGLGTSNNSGSDKQTYYRLGTHGAQADTPAEFAQTLTAGGCTHGDVALAEAENSLRCFYHLVDIGVPFPHNERGGFVGYTTDYDPRRRGTSAGPWTSRFMVRKLLAELEHRGLRIFDGHHVLAVIRDGGGACGVLCADMTRQAAEDHGLVLFNCRNIVMAGGGPGDLYEISVYPEGQMGPYAPLLEAGAVVHNLTESQFGLASLAPRWNLSGTYQQVIPRYFSTGPGGGDARDFLNHWFESMPQLAGAVFLKGYEWPFDPGRAAGHCSSLIDVLVQHEMVNRGRRVFLDFRSNPSAGDGLGDLRLDAVPAEALSYLKKSGALQDTPLGRLAHMNRPSVDLYAEKGVDLTREPLEVGVCAQHCNGGFAVDAWWESNVPHLFVIGELAGTHGVRRPGGAALNSGQVGGLRAAQRIAHVYFRRGPSADGFPALARLAVARVVSELGRIKGSAGGALDCARVKANVRRRMSRHGGMVRSREGVASALAAARRQWRSILCDGLRQDGPGYLAAWEARELALTQLAFLAAIAALLARGSGSRGSHAVTAPEGVAPHEDLGPEWRIVPEDPRLRGEILCIAYDAGADAFATRTVAPRPMPDGEFWFENTWGEFRRGEVFRKDPSEETRPHRT